MNKVEVICITQIILNAINIIFRIDWLIIPMVILMLVVLKEYKDLVK